MRWVCFRAESPIPGYKRIKTKSILEFHGTGDPNQTVLTLKTGVIVLVAESISTVEKALNIANAE